MKQFLVQGAAVMVLTILVSWLRLRAGRRRRSKIELGGEAQAGARLGLHGDKLRPGRLVLAASRTIWTRRRGRGTVDLTGAHVLSSAVAPGNYGTNGFVLLRLRLSDGTPAQLQLYREDAATLAGLLQGDLPEPAAAADVPSRRERPPSRRSWWAIGCLVLGLGWVATNVVAALDGETAQARVTGGDGQGLCRVVWADAQGATHQGEVSCSDEPRGTQVPVLVFGWPDSGDPWNDSDVVVMLLVTSLPLLTIGGGRLLYVRARRRAWAAAQDWRQPGKDMAIDDVPVALPPLQNDDVRAATSESLTDVVSRLAPYARRQVPDDGWEDPRRPSGGPGWAFVLLRIGRALAGPLGALLLIATLTGPLLYQWLLLQHTVTATAVATSTGDVTSYGLGPFPDEVSVRFRDPRGSTQLADVATTGALPKGEQVSIEYAVSQPGWARLAGPADGLAVGTELSAGAAVLTLLWAACALWSVGRIGRATRLAGQQPPRPAVGLLTADGDGLPVVLGADPAISPPRLVVVPLLAPLPHGTSAAFASAPAPIVTVRGRLADGEVVVLEVPGVTVPLLPRGKAAAVGNEALLNLVDSAGALARFLTAEEERVGRTAD